MDDFEIELKMGFLEEAKELLVDAEQCFLNLEKASNDPSIIEKIFRVAHNLKGSAGAVGFADLSHFTHVLESFLLRIKNKELPINQEIISLLLECNDFLSSSLDGLKNSLDYKVDGHHLVHQLEAYISGQAPVASSEPAPAVAEEGSAPTEDAAPEAQTFDQASFNSGRAAAAAATPPKVAKDENIRVSLSRIDELLNNVGELVILQSMLSQQINAADVNPTMQTAVSHMSKIIKDVQSISMSLRMLPIKQTFQKMQRIVRDTSGALNKKVDLILSGEEAEIDKTVLEHLSDPLVHLIRNAVDHGLETPEERIALGKDPVGKVHLSAEQKAGQMVIEIRDDGKGLDAKKLIRKAKDKKIISEHANPSDQEAYNLIFAAGFSTKEQVTDVSGRGVGMDVVKTNITNLQGDIELVTELGKGTCFRIKLPLTLAIIDAMVVLIGEEKYIIPASQIREFFKPEVDNISSVLEKGEVLNLRGDTVSIYRLDSLLKRKPKVHRQTSDCVAIIAEDARPFAIMVDEVVSQQQVVIKKLGGEIQGLSGITGASILGDGKVSFILDLQELTFTARNKNKKVPKKNMQEAA